MSGKTVPGLPVGQVTMAERPQSSAMLLAEHSRLASLYQHNADMGDKYVSIYLTIVSAAAAFLAGLQRLAVPSSAVVSIQEALLLVVPFVGITTFARLLERRVHAIEYLRAINRIHLTSRAVLCRAERKM